MAQPNDALKTTPAEASNAPRPQDSSGHMQGGASSFSSNSSSKIKMENDHEDHGNHHHKKSVLTKMKEKARKLKKSMSGRKRREDNEGSYTTPPGSASATDNHGKDRSEYFGSPSYEPTNAPNTDKQSEKEKTQDPNKGSNDNNPENSSEAIENTQPQDKGVSVKEYIMNKFEPGDDERALSQVITQTISPKCEKMKEVVNSILGNDETNESVSKGSNLELDITPSSSSVESNDKKLSSMNDENLGSSLHGSSNLKPGSGLHSDPLNSNPSANITQSHEGSGLHSDPLNSNPSANITQSHEGTKDENLSKGS